MTTAASVGASAHGASPALALERVTCTFAARSGAKGARGGSYTASVTSLTAV